MRPKRLETHSRKFDEVEACELLHGADAMHDQFQQHTHELLFMRQGPFGLIEAKHMLIAETFLAFTAYDFVSFAEGVVRFN